MEETERTIDDARAKLQAVFETFTVEDFRRVHAKFVGGTIALEVAFKRRFPDEWAIYEREFYGDDVIE